MTKGRDNHAVAHIEYLLEVARTQQRNGMLTVTSSQAEEGEIYVLSGQPIYARVGNLLGDEALKRLLTWKTVSFSFAPEALRPRANLATAQQANRRFESGTLALPQTQPIPVPVSSRYPITDELKWKPSTAASTPFNSRGHTTQRTDHLVPQKIGPERSPTFLALSRRQRVVYFLVDGKRSIGDLARCANKDQDEVERILSELQEQGMVTL